VKWGVAPLVLVVFLASAAVSERHDNRMTLSNIDDNNTGWGSCTSCAGGANNADAYWMAQNQSAPALDRNSTQFYVSATQPYSDVLFWEKLGPQDWATQFTWDFWFYLDNASTGAQALEYDMFQFVSGIEYMFGTQCLYATGNWNVWSQGGKTWVPTSVPCQKFAPNRWHHLVWQFHRTADTQMHYDTLTLDGVPHVLNLTEPSGPLPSGWGDNLGVQWQLDTASVPIAFNQWIDNVKLTIR
jgi:hypothetical protein